MPGWFDENAMSVDPGGMATPAGWWQRPGLGDEWWNQGKPPEQWTPFPRDFPPYDQPAQVNVPPVQPSASLPALPGGLGQYTSPAWSYDKLNDPAHTSPKYLVGRVLSHFAPSAEGLRQALPYLNQLGIGTFSIVGGGKGDRVNIQSNDPRWKGFTSFDFGFSFGDPSHSAWQFNPVGQGGAGGGGAATTRPRPLPSYMNAQDPLERQMIDILRQHGHSPLNAADWQEWLGGLRSGSATLDVFQQAVQETMARPDAARYEWDETVPAEAEPSGGAAAGEGAGEPGDFVAPWTEEFGYKAFAAPTYEDVIKTPGYLFRLGEGQKALERTASARGTLNTGGTLKDLAGWTQDLASTEYGQAYGRGLGEWERGLNKDLQEYLLRRENFYEGQDRPFEKWYSLADLGQRGAGAQAALEAAYARGAGDILLGGAGTQGDYLTGGAAARAAGRVGSANAWGGALGNIGNMGMNLAYLGMLREGPGGAWRGNVSSYVPRGLPRGYTSVYDTLPR